MYIFLLLFAGNCCYIKMYFSFLSISPFWGFVYLDDNEDISYLIFVCHCEIINLFKLLLAHLSGKYFQLFYIHIYIYFCYFIIQIPA